MVTCDLTQIFSVAFLPVPAAQSAGGLASGFESISNLIFLNACTIRAITVEASLYANCCPRQIRGPALNGRKMKGFGTKYLLTLSSRNRSGSKSLARGSVSVSGGRMSDMSVLTSRSPQVLPPMHQPWRIVDHGLRRDVYRFPSIYRGPEYSFLRASDIQGTVSRSVQTHRRTASSRNSHIRVQA